MNAFAALAPLRAKLTAEQEDLAAELIEKFDWFRLDAITSPAIADEAVTWLRRRVDALVEVRADELAYGRLERDREWLTTSSEVLDAACTLLLQVKRKRRELRGAA